MHANDDTRGFTLIELLVGLLMISLVMTGVVKMLGVHMRAYTQQNLSQDLEQNLRSGMVAITESLRFSGGNLGSITNYPVWFPWMSGFTANPTISTSPQKISIAVPTSYPIAYFKKREDAKSTHFELISAVSGQGLLDLVNTTTKRLILVSDEQLALVMSATSNEVTVDTDPLKNGNQGLMRSYTKNTPVYRVDVLTYSIENDPSTNKPQLRVNNNQGAGTTPVADNISSLQIVPINAGETYDITLTGVSDTTGPLSGTTFTRSLTSTMAVRNALGDLKTSVDVSDIGDTDEPDDSITLSNDPDQDIPLPPDLPPPPTDF